MPRKSSTPVGRKQQVHSSLYEWRGKVNASFCQGSANNWGLQPVSRDGCLSLRCKRNRKQALHKDNWIKQEAHNERKSHIVLFMCFGSQSPTGEKPNTRTTRCAPRGMWLCGTLSANWCGLQHAFSSKLKYFFSFHLIRWENTARNSLAHADAYSQADSINTDSAE